MMFVPSDRLNVVPRRGLMTQKALVDSRIGPIRDTPRNHREVLHVMTGGCLMALGTADRIRRWVLIVGNRPIRCGVAIRAVLAEHAKMRILPAVARGAIQQSLALQ